MADKYQPHATRTLKTSGFWAEKFIDMHFVNKKGKVSSKKTKNKVYPTSGRPDMYYFKESTDKETCLRGGFIEVKSPKGDNGSRFPYSEWREDQRNWYHREAVPRKWTIWMFLVMGNSIRDKKYPKKAFLFPVKHLIELEATEQSRKSLSYDRACRKLERYILDWHGNQTWFIQSDHPFREQFD